MNPHRGESASNEQWAPISDLMAALMLIFMFIAIAFIRTVVIAETTHREECNKIYKVLGTEFDRDFADWDVKLMEDLTIRFRNPEVLFKSGEDQIRPYFAEILSDFFPRYMRVVRAREYRDDIREIRIEGHTSSVWQGARDERVAYFKNMDLSQRRTSAILRFVLELPESAEYAEWVRAFITANGLSSSRLILKEDGSEDHARSRRVEFRLMTASCQKSGVYDEAERQRCVEHENR